MDFSSDTSAPVHPNVLAALSEANSGMAGSYGQDRMTERLRSLVAETFGTGDVTIFPVASGTAANALALSVLCGPTEAVLCHESAHIACDERGAPEFYTGGGKLRLLGGGQGRIAPEELQTACQQINPAFVHETPASVLSLTNLTESGTAYQAQHISRLCGIAKAFGLAVHLDGARLANALVSTGATPAEMSSLAGVDILTLGLTKTGAAGCEIICLFGTAQDRYRDLLARAKRGGHLPPKLRYLSAQGVAMLMDGLWLSLARRANLSAQRLAEVLTAQFGAELVSPVDGNEVFARLPDMVQARLFESGLKAYPWSGNCVRFVCNWSGSESEIDHLTKVCI